MKKLITLSMMTLALTLTSCAHHGGCCSDGKQCDMKKEKCADCKDKNHAQCPMKDGQTTEAKKEETKK